jgi:phospho-N-acetylmuramoyl-pentapeptide-transferase
MLNLLRRVGYAFIISMIIAAVIAPLIINYLKKCKLEQVLRDRNEVHDLAQLHSSKTHTPTMGGMIMIIAMLCGTISSVHWNFQVILVLFCYLAVAILGFIDDLRKFERKICVVSPDVLNY